jgi:hypothetical protein
MSSAEMHRLLNGQLRWKIGGQIGDRLEAGGNPIQSSEPCRANSTILLNINQHPEDFSNRTLFFLGYKIVTKYYSAFLTIRLG